MISKSKYSVLSMKNQKAQYEDFAKPKNEIEMHTTNSNSSPIKESSSATMNKKPCNESRSTITYALYTYRKELERRRLNIIRLAQAKINLTDGLVINTAKILHKRLDNGAKAKTIKDEMDVLSREVFYKKKLYEMIKNVEEMLKKKKEAVKQGQQKQSPAEQQKVVVQYINKC